MSNIGFRCPKCHEHLEADSSDAGNVVSCPKCSAKIRIPQGKRAADSSAATETREGQRTSTALLAAVVILVVLCVGLGTWVFALTRSKTGSASTGISDSTVVPIVASAPPGAAESRERPSILETVASKVLPDVQLSGEIFIVTKDGQSVKLGLVTVGLIPLETLSPYLSARNEQVAKELARLNPLIAAAYAEYKAGTAERVRLSKEYDEAFKSYLSNMRDVSHLQDGSARKRYHDVEGQQHRNSDAISKALKEWRRLLDERRPWVRGDFHFSELPAPIRSAKTNADGKFELQVPRSGNFALAASASRLVGDNTEKYFWLVRLDNQGPANQSVMLSNDNLTSSRSPASLLETE